MQQLIDEYKAMKAEFQKKLQAGLKDVFKEFFDIAPEIKTIRWTQYIPYFNDGEECTFSVNDLNFSNVGPDCLSTYGELEDDDEELGPASFSESAWGLKHYSTNERYGGKPAITIDPNTIIACEKLSKMVQDSALEDVMRATFGEHAYVTVTREAMTAEQYEHE